MSQHPRFSRTGPALLAVLAITAAACGGSSTPPPPPQPLASPTVALPPAPQATATRPPAPAGATGTPGAPPTGTRPAGGATPVVSTPGTGQITGAALQRAWQAKGFQVQIGSAQAPVAGFTAAAAEVRLVRGTATAQVTLLVYANSQALEQEWTVKPGSAPEPKGRPAPPGVEATWWNHNVIGLVRNRSADLGPEALQAFLDATP